jgi:hypothetical protein
MEIPFHSLEHESKTVRGKKGKKMEINETTETSKKNECIMYSTYMREQLYEEDSSMREISSMPTVSSSFFMFSFFFLLCLYLTSLPVHHSSSLSVPPTRSPRL